jgi:hypothetical protein
MTSGARSLRRIPSTTRARYAGQRRVRHRSTKQQPPRSSSLESASGAGSAHPLLVQTATSQHRTRISWGRPAGRHLELTEHRSRDRRVMACAAAALAAPRLLGPASRLLNRTCPQARRIGRQPLSSYLPMMLTRPCPTLSGLQTHFAIAWRSFLSACRIRCRLGKASLLELLASIRSEDSTTLLRCIEDETRFLQGTSFGVRSSTLGFPSPDVRPLALVFARCGSWQPTSGAASRRRQNGKRPRRLSAHTSMCGLDPVPPEACLPPG